jgi:hypothetical protein
MSRATSRATYRPPPGLSGPRPHLPHRLTYAANTMCGTPPARGGKSCFSRTRTINPDDSVTWTRPDGGTTTTPMATTDYAAN